MLWLLAIIITAYRSDDIREKQYQAELKEYREELQEYNSAINDYKKELRNYYGAIIVDLNVPDSGKLLVNVSISTKLDRMARSVVVAPHTGAGVEIHPVM